MKEKLKSAVKLALLAAALATVTVCLDVVLSHELAVKALPEMIRETIFVRFCWIVVSLPISGILLGHGKKTGYGIWLTFVFFLWLVAGDIAFEVDSRTVFFAPILLLIGYLIGELITRVKNTILRLQSNSSTSEG